MPITNEITIKPSTGGGSSAVVPEGLYDVEVSDITYIPPEQNPLYGKAQLRFKFKILVGKEKDLELSSWVGMSINPGWDQGKPSNLFKIVTAVMGEEPDMEKEFLPNVLLGGTLQILVENRKSKDGKEYSKVTNFLKSKGLKLANPEPSEPVEDDFDIPEEPKTETMPF